MVSDIIMGPEYRGKKSSRQAFSGLETDPTIDQHYDMNESVKTDDEYRPSFTVNLDESSSDIESKDEDGELFMNEEMSEEDEKPDPALTFTESQNVADKLEEELDKEDNQKGIDIATIQNQQKKAEHTMNQRIIWDALLDFRINFQIIMDMANRLPGPKDHSGFLESENSEELKIAYEEANEEISGLLDDFSALQQKIRARDSLVKVPFGNDGLNTNWEDVYKPQQTLEEAINPMLDQWQSKLIPVNTKRHFKLKTINQNVRSQVAGTLSGRNFSNILRRSQTLAENSDKLFGVLPAITPCLPEIYNDGDFYTQLIKDRLQSGLSTSYSSDPLEMSQKYFKLQQLKKRKKKTKTVDTRASKGRRIRYHVHDKLVSFMAPMPNYYPNQESLMAQILFRHLFGTSPET